MTELWPETSGCTPFAVLGIVPGASVMEIRQAFKRMALRTHPDKQHTTCSDTIATTTTTVCPTQDERCTSSAAAAAVVVEKDGVQVGSEQSNTGTLAENRPVGYPFHLVKAAAELLLDPRRRRNYEQQYMQAAVREIGAASERCSLQEDFVLVAEEKAVSTGRVEWRLYERECRCGGCYEVVYFVEEEKGEEKEEESTRSVVRRLCECESCSLIIEVECDVE